MEVAEPRPAMSPAHLSQRVLDFAVAVIRMANAFPSSVAGRHIASQLIRSATSIGANYEEACAGQSRADFNHKLHIALKEARETAYWLRLTERLDFIGPRELGDLRQESSELVLILAKSLVTAKGIHA